MEDLGRFMDLIPTGNAALDEAINHMVTCLEQYDAGVPLTYDWEESLDALQTAANGVELPGENQRTLEDLISLANSIDPPGEDPPGTHEGRPTP